MLAMIVFFRAVITIIVIVITIVIIIIVIIIIITIIIILLILLTLLPSRKRVANMGREERAPCSNSCNSTVILLDLLDAG